MLDLDDSIDLVFVTAYDDYAVKAFDMSALDYLMKPVTAQRMSKTLDKIRKRHRNAAAWPSMSHNEILTEQETKVLRLIADGLSNKEIALVYRKLGVINRVQALQRGRELRILG